MKERKVPFSPPDITEEEIAEVSDALRSGWITTGPRTKQLEKEVAAFCESPNGMAACLNSATAALELSLRVLGIGEGDEVITSAYTYTASASVIAHVGAKIILVDTQPDSYEMDYDQLEQAISTRTKAIIPVDLGGVPCDYDLLFEIVERQREKFFPRTEIQRKIGHVAMWQMVRTHLELRTRDRKSDRLQTLHHSLSTQSRILRRRKVEQHFGR